MKGGMWKIGSLLRGLIKEMKKIVIVLREIEVPKGNYCYDRNGVCGEFYEGICKQGFMQRKVTADGLIVKPAECFILKEKQ